MASIRPISAALSRKAREELHEVESRIPDDIEALRTWIKQERHLITPLDDQFLVTFLRGSKYSLQKAKEKIENFFSIRQAMTEIFTNRDPLDPKILDIYRTGTSLFLQKPLSEDGPGVIIIRPSCYDPLKYTFKDVIKVSSIIGDILMLENDNVTIGGTIGVLDLANVTKEHFFQFDLSLMKKMTMLSQEGQPLRQKGFHYLNVPSSFEKVFNIMKGFMNEKNRSRVFLHSSVETLYDHIPKDLLPTEYGGKAGSLVDIQNYWEQTMIEKRDFILEWDKYGTNESLRVTNFKLKDEFYGVEGSFRKLVVD